MNDPHKSGCSGIADKLTQPGACLAGWRDMAWKHMARKHMALEKADQSTGIRYSIVLRAKGSAFAPIWMRATHEN